MNPTGFDEILFRGIPPNPRRGRGTFFTSLIVHIAGVALLLLVAPQLILNNRNSLHFSTTLVAPPETPAVPKPTPRPVIVAKTEQPVLRELRPLPRPAEPRISTPKLDAPPELPKTPRQAIVLPETKPVIEAPVKTGLFAANLPPKIEPKLPAVTAQAAGFDTVAEVKPSVPRSAVIAAAGFEANPAASRPAATAAVVQTGAFGQSTAGDPQSTRRAGKVTRTAFDTSAEIGRPTAINETVRKTGFDQPQVASTPIKPVAPVEAAVRPVEILDKPKPAYTAEARAKKIEGTVLLDVVFAATGQVRVLGVVSGLGHGLDESAVDAARRIRFTPAKKSGTPVDERVLLHVVFQITG